MCAFAVGQASAATTYSVAIGSGFDGGAEGWTAVANEHSGPLCVEGLTCPAVSDEYRASGGVEGSGYLETKEGGVVSVGLVAESTGVWESPEFTYIGVGGQRPTKVELTLARRAQLASLLGLSGAGAAYTVELVDATAPSRSVVAVNRATLAGAEEWKQASTAISPTVLTKGDAYKMRIRTTFVTPAAVVPAGGVGYDEVELRASREEGDEAPRSPGSPESGGGGTNGSHGARGGSGGAGSAGSEGSGGAGGKPRSPGAKGGGTRGLSAADLRSALGSGALAASARLQRGRLVVVGKCPRAVRAACTVRVRGMLTHARPATSTGRARIGAGGRHRFAVAVDPRALPKVEGRSRLLVKEWVRVGKSRVTLYRQLRLVRR